MIFGCRHQTVQLYGECFQSLSPNSGVATMLQVKVSTSQLWCRSSAPLLCVAVNPRLVVISAHSHKVSLQSLFLFQCGVPDRLDQRPQSPSTHRILCILFQWLHRSPVHSLSFCIECSRASATACVGGSTLLRPSRSRVLVLCQMHLHVMCHVRARLLPLLRPSHLVALLHPLFPVHLWICVVLRLLVLRPTGSHPEAANAVDTVCGHVIGELFCHSEWHGLGRSI